MVGGTHWHGGFWEKLGGKVRSRAPPRRPGKLNRWSIHRAHPLHGAKRRQESPASVSWRRVLRFVEAVAMPKTLSGMISACQHRRMDGGAHRLRSSFEWFFPVTFAARRTLSAFALNLATADMNRRWLLFELRWSGLMSAVTRFMGGVAAMVKARMATMNPASGGARQSAARRRWKPADGAHEVTRPARRFMGDCLCDQSPWQAGASMLGEHER